MGAGVIYSEDGVVDFKYLEKVVEFQERQGFHAGNSLKWKHIRYKEKIMNVRLAAQTLSLSTSDALKYFEHTVRAPEFIGATATSNFCKHLNNAFDILNSQALSAKYSFKRKICENNIDRIENNSKSLITYIKSLKNEQGVPMYRVSHLSRIAAVTQ